MYNYFNVQTKLYIFTDLYLDKILNTSHNKKYFVFMLKIIFIKIFVLIFLTYPSVNLT